MQLNIRHAGPGDAPVIVDFNRWLAEESEGKTLDAETLEPGVAAVLADRRKGLYFLAEADGRPVGQVGVTFEWSDWRNGWFWWIQSVYVRKEARRQGVFRALYGHVEEMARRDPEVIGLRLYVEQGNEAAQKTYLGLGLARTGYFVLEKYPLIHAVPRQAAALKGNHPPAVFVLAGSNGAGKTTASRTLLADRMKLMTFVNADIIAQGIGGFNPDTVAVEAGRIMLQRLDELAAARADFALETTLSGLTLAAWLKGLKESGYIVHLVYFWLANPELAVARVAERVHKGGHHVPEATIRRRYQRSIQNFFQRYRSLATTWEVYNNTAPGVYELIAYMDPDVEEKVLNSKLWEQFRRSS
jgi:predicted ABC-type ATPase/ribosomal protein S18 acetylase RimI-like enzyme